MTRKHCGCRTGDEGTTFCDKHRTDFALILATDNDESPFEVYARLEHEGLPCTAISYCNGHHFPEVVAQFEEVFQRKMNPEPIPDGYLPGEEDDGQPDEAQEWELIEGPERILSVEDAHIDGATDQELDAEYERQHEERNDWSEE